jgi:hypothetical protein
MSESDAWATIEWWWNVGIVVSHVVAVVPLCFALKRRKWGIAWHVAILAVCSTVYHIYEITGRVDTLPWLVFQVLDFTYAYFSITVFTVHAAQYPPEAEWLERAHTAIGWFGTLICALWIRFSIVTIAALVGWNVLCFLVRRPVVGSWPTLDWKDALGGGIALALAVACQFALAVYVSYAPFHMAWHILCFVSFAFLLDLDIVQRMFCGFCCPSTAVQTIAPSQQSDTVVLETMAVSASALAPVLASAHTSYAYR